MHQKHDHDITEDKKWFYVTALYVGEKLYFCDMYGETLATSPKGTNVERFSDHHEAEASLDTKPVGAFVVKIAEQRTFKVYHLHENK